MEIRGLGIINIKDLFGISAVRDDKKIELVVELSSGTRRGVRPPGRRGAGQSDPRRGGADAAVPIRPGRNITSIIEVAARNQLLKFQGKHSAREFQERLNRALIDARERRWRDEVE